MDVVQAMRAFRRVVELRSFSAAARDLRLSNAAVSKYVSSLEERLATRLLLRTTRRVSPTTSGAAYYDRCVRLLEDLDDAERSMAGAGAAARGTLRVNVPVSFGLLHVAPLIPDLLARHPDLRVELTFSDRFVDLVEEGVDVAVRIAAELPDSTTLVAQRLASSGEVLCASPKYLRRRREPKRPADLVDHECIVYSLSRQPGEWTFQGADGPERVRVTGRLVASNSVVIRQAVLAGQGIGLLPAFYVGKDLRTRKLRPLLRGYGLRTLTVHAVYQRSRHLSARVRAFVEFLRERFARAEWNQRPVSRPGRPGPADRPDPAA